MACSLRVRFACGSAVVLGAAILWFGPSSWGSMSAERVLREIRLQTSGDDTQSGPVYRPIFMMHGINDNAKSEFTSMARWVKEAHPGTATYPIAMFEDSPGSWVHLQEQIDEIAKYIRKEVSADPALFANGYHLVCHSQGGIVCRTLVQHMDDHNVHTLVSLAGPQMGVFGPAFFDFMKKLPGLKEFTYDNVYTFAYMALAQKTLSVANLWNDPMHHDKFVESKTYFAVYNGLTNDPGNQARKANFVRLQKAVFLTGIPESGDYDGGIEPACSGVFEYFRDGSKSERVPMKSQYIYTADTFGLKTLDEAGRLVASAVPGVGHHTWVDNEDVFRKYILPHLV